MTTTTNVSGVAFDRLVDALEAVGLGVDRKDDGVMAQCPAHDDETPSLAVTLAPGRVLLHCFALCPTEDVVEALGLTMADLFDTPLGLTLEEYAEAKLLDADELRSWGVHDDDATGAGRLVIDYFDRDGGLVTRRYRLAMGSTSSPAPRFVWKKGAKAMLYGLEQFDSSAKYVIVVEGESDVHTLRHHGYNTVGLPGAGTLSGEELARELGEIENVYVVIEPDSAGKSLADTIGQSQLARKSFFVRLDGVKDVSDLHLSVEGGRSLFKEKLGRALEDAVRADSDLANSGQSSINGYERVRTDGNRPMFRDRSITGASHEIAFDQAPPHPRAFFSRESGLYASMLVEWVERAGPIASGPGRSVWWYSHGVWLPDGDSEVHRRVRLLLGNKYRRSYAQTALDVLSHRVPFIGRQEPLWGKINVANGVLDWRTGELKPHSSAYPFTWQLPIGWNPSAQAPTVNRWLAEVFPGAEGSAGTSVGHRLAFEIIGYPLLGKNLLHKGVILHGGGRNGKGTFLRLQTALYGKENTSSVSLQSMASNRFSVAEIFGKLANIMGDLDSSGIKYTDRIKQVTGGDELYAERKYGQPFTFTATALPMFAANDIPTPQSDFTEGFFSRWLIVPFDRGYFPEGTADPLMDDRLQAELEGVLVQSIAAIRALVDRRAFSSMTETTTATRNYRVQADPVLAFIEARVRPADASRNRWVPRAEIYEQFDFFANRYGTNTLSRQKFYEQFAERFRWRHEHGLATSKRQTDGYKNIELLDEEATIAAIGSLSFSEIRQQAEDSIHDSSESA